MRKPDPSMGEIYHGIRTGEQKYGKFVSKRMSKVAEGRAMNKIEHGLTKQPQGGVGSQNRDSSGVGMQNRDARGVGSQNRDSRGAVSKNIMPAPRKLGGGSPKQNIQPMPRMIKKVDPKKAIQPSKRY